MQSCIHNLDGAIVETLSCLGTTNHPNVKLARFLLGLFFGHATISRPIVLNYSIAIISYISTVTIGYTLRRQTLV